MKLREVEVLLGQGKSTKKACQALEISEQPYYRWRKEYGGLSTTKRVQSWLKRLDVKPLFIEPGSSWENGYIESFNGEMRDKLLNGEIFYSL